MMTEKTRPGQAIADQRAHVLSKAASLGLAISKLPGGYRLLGKRIDLWVTDLCYVTDYDLTR